MNAFPKEDPFMIAFRKIALSALSVFALVSCGGATESASAAKSNLEGQGFTVSVYNADEYKKLSIAATLQGSDKVQNHLVATKSNAESPAVFAAWFFGSFDDADSFRDTNLTVLARVYDGEENAMGSHNNVVWVGNKEAATKLGWRIVA